MIQFDEGLRHPVEITLFDLAGRQHMARQVDVRGTTRLNLGHLPRGIYLVRIKVGDQYANRKVIVN